MASVLLSPKTESSKHQLEATIMYMNLKNANPLLSDEPSTMNLMVIFPHCHLLDPQIDFLL